MTHPMVTDEDRSTASAIGIPEGARLGRAIVTGSVLDPPLPEMSVDCLGVEMPLSPVERPTPWPVVVDGALSAPHRVLQVWQRVVRREGSPLVLTATWRPDGRGSQALSGMEGSSTKDIERFLGPARRLLFHSDPGGRPPGSRSRRRIPVLDAIRANPGMTDEEVISLAISHQAWDFDGGDYHLRARRIARFRQDSRAD